MATALLDEPRAGVDYAESDGQPMADNTTQFRWIVTLQENLDSMLPEAFVAGDLFWYPVQDNNRIKQAPDVLVALGRPKGDRGSYRQWEEGGVAPQVVFEILSPSNRVMEMLKKERFYDRYGVMEYYVYDPDDNELEGWQRVAGQWQRIPELNGWTSPLLGIRFTLTAETLVIYRADGSQFETFAELSRRAANAQQAREAALAQATREQQAREAALAQAAREQQAKEAALAQAAREQQAKEAALAQAAQERQVNEALRAELEKLQRQLAMASAPPSAPTTPPEHRS